MPVTSQSKLSATRTTWPMGSRSPKRRRARGSVSTMVYGRSRAVSGEPRRSGKPKTRRTPGSAVSTLSEIPSLVPARSSVGLLAVKRTASSTSGRWSWRAGPSWTGSADVYRSLSRRVGPQYAVDAVLVLVEVAHGELVRRQLDDQQAEGQADGQPEEVDRRVAALPPQVAEGGGQVASPACVSFRGWDPPSTRCAGSPPGWSWRPGSPAGPPSGRRRGRRGRPRSGTGRGRPPRGRRSSAATGRRATRRWGC